MVSAIFILYLGTFLIATCSAMLSQIPDTTVLRKIFTELQNYGGDINLANYRGFTGNRITHLDLFIFL